MPETTHTSPLAYTALTSLKKSTPVLAHVGVVWRVLDQNCNRVSTTYAASSVSWNTLHFDRLPARRTAGRGDFVEVRRLDRSAGRLLEFRSVFNRVRADADRGNWRARSARGFFTQDSFTIRAKLMSAGAHPPAPRK